jgi:hypothetical protein
MSEGGAREQDPEPGRENTGTGDTLRQAATGDEGVNPAQGTPPIEGDQRAGQTQTPAPDDDTGVPEDLDERTD